MTERRKVWRLDLDSGTTTRVDHLAVEEPLEVRVDGETLTVTMRTPGADFELVHGLLRAEGLVRGRDDVATIRYCGDTTELNVVEATLRAPSGLPVSEQRRLVSHSGCGLCGRTSIDAMRAAMTGPLADVRMPAKVLAAAPERLREEQRVFDRTGGLHAAALVTATGDLVVAREDVGRHNAVDKVLGWALMHDRRPDDLALVVSSRASFEIVQKAAVAGIGVLSCISAPSSLAVEAADEAGLTLVAFSRGRTMTVCTHPHRITT